MTGTLRNYDELVTAYENMRWAMANDVNPRARDAARNILKLAAERCGYGGDSELLIWCRRRVETYRKLIVGSCRGFDAAVKALPPEQLAQVFQ